MKYRCRYIIKTILTLLLVVCPLWGTTISISKNIPPPEKTLKDYCLDISNRLNNLGYISVSPEQFASFIYKVSYCESGHKIKARGDSGSIGLWQMTAKTRNRLGVKHGGIEVQVENYFKFLAAGGKKLRLIKNSVDLHCYNFTPGNFLKDTLSQVTNERLRALDLNKDSVITREDIKLFQKLRLKA